MMPRGHTVKTSVLLLIAYFASSFAQSIHDGVREDSPEKIKQALAAGADINTIGQGGQTPLMNGVLSGKTAAVEFLLKQGADTKIGEKDGYTPMHGAGFQGRADIAKLLIAHGLDANDRHSDGYTAYLHFHNPSSSFEREFEFFLPASINGRFMCPKFQHLAPHARTRSIRRQRGRFTPLHRACWGSEKRHTDTVAVLLEAGVPFDQQAADGSRPIDMARNNAGTRKLLKRWERRARKAKSQPVA